MRIVGKRFHLASMTYRDNEVDENSFVIHFSAAPPAVSKYSQRADDESLPQLQPTPAVAGVRRSADEPAPAPRSKKIARPAAKTTTATHPSTVGTADDSKTSTVSSPATVIRQRPVADTGDEAPTKRPRTAMSDEDAKSNVPQCEEAPTPEKVAHSKAKIDLQKTLRLFRTARDHVRSASAALENARASGIASSKKMDVLQRRHNAKEKKYKKQEALLKVAQLKVFDTARLAEPQRVLENRERVKTALRVNFDNLYNLLLKDISQCLPKQGHIVNLFSVFDIRQIPSGSAAQKVWFSSNTRSLRDIFHHFERKNILALQEHPHGARLAPQTNINLWPVGATADQLLLEVRRMLPTLARFGNIVSGHSGRSNKPAMTANEVRMHFEAGAESRLSTDDSVTLADAFQNILLLHSSSEPLACRAIKFMLTYSDNSAGPERIFSLTNAVKTRSRAHLTHMLLQDTLQICANPLPFEEVNAISAIRNERSVQITNEP